MNPSSHMVQPPAGIPSQQTGDYVELVDGRSVPLKAVQALDELEKIWPGATFPTARHAIVAAVMESLGIPCCNNNE